MNKPEFDAEAQCPVCDAAAVAMVSGDPDWLSGVSWCEKGHVVVMTREPLRLKQLVFDFNQLDK